MQKAWQRLQRNLMILLHLLFIAVLAVALADPFIEGEATSSEAVIIIDRSASMGDDMENIDKFVEEFEGEKNTVIAAGTEVEVLAERVPPSTARRVASDVMVRDVETDIASALELARDYSGDVVVASDLDQTTSDRNVVSILKGLESSGRDIHIMETRDVNRWGVVNVEPRRGNTSIDIKNLMDQELDIPLTVDGEKTTVTTDPGDVRTLTIPTVEGATTARLGPDPVPGDNVASVAIPREETYDVVFISPGNRYFESAVEVIPFTRITVVDPPAQNVPEGDIYVIGKSDRFLRSTASELEKRTKRGASLVVFAQPEVFEKVESLPVTREGERRNVTVEITEPRRISVGKTSVFSVERNSGTSLATNNAVVTAKLGRGRIVFYNIRDRDFHFDFMYPIFWKDVFDSITERPDITERNLDTGITINSSRVVLPNGEERRGEVRTTVAGIYNTTQGLYAATLTSPEETTVDSPEIDVEDGGTETAKKSKQPLVIATLILLASAELAYLAYRGSV